MPSSIKDKKVEISFTNWVLGGSLVSVSSTESHRNYRKRVASRKVIVTEVDSDGNETIKPEEDGKKGNVKEKARDEGAGKHKEIANKCEDNKCEKCGKEKKEKSDNTKEESKKGDSKLDKDEKDDRKGDSKAEESKKNDSKASESGKDEKKLDDSDTSKNIEMSGGSGESNRNWTAEQDQKIKDMKAANKSWKDIAAELGASKKDITNRFKDLCKDGEQNIGSLNDEKKDESQNTNSTCGGEDTGGLDFSNLFDDFGSGAEPSKDINTSDQKNNSSSFWDRRADVVNSDTTPNNDSDSFCNQPVGTNINKSDSRARNNAGQQSENYGSKNKNEGKDQGGGGNQSSNWNRSGNGRGSNKQDWNGSHNGPENQTQNWNNSGNGSNGRNDYNNDSQNQNWSQTPKVAEKQTWDHNFRANQRSIGQLQVNDVWSKDDCEVLEYLHKQYEEHKWLHIQAGFFNWTGRMIVAEIIEQKFRDDGAI